MNRINPRIATAAGILLTGLALTSLPAAHAQLPLLTNLDATPATFGSAISSTVLRSISFTTGTTDYTLSSVQADLAAVSAGSPAGVDISMYTPSTMGGSDPGTLIADLGTVTVSTVVSAHVTYTYTPSSAIALEANTRYVFLLTNPSGGNGAWVPTNPNVTPTARNGSGFNSVTYRVSTNSGTSYTSTGTADGFAVNGIAAASAPETGALALLLPMSVPIAWCIARRRGAA